ncbi:hypothetical protein JCM11491_000699 [Sporobolomyces phaffii]
MSTSSSSAGTASLAVAPGQCVVCGKSTWNRCSECAKFGTDWMCFCSTDHQRIVWDMHRGVCGIRSNPFQWPGYTQDELDAIESLLKKPRLDESGQVTTAQQGIAAGLDAHGEPGDLFWASCVVGICALRMVTRHALNQFIQDDSQTIPADDEFPRVFFRQPFDSLILCEEVIQSGLATHEGTFRDAPWWSTFQHKILIQIGVCVTPEPIAEEDYVAFARHTEAELARFVREVVAVTHPSEAANLLEKLRYLELD